jgi:hypothetical protein
VKQSFKTGIVWLIAVTLIAAAHQASAFGPQVERSLELNGISDTFGSQNAFFVLTQPDVWATPRSFMLAVGESRYGIKLLAVDAQFSHVQIEREGLKQSLRLRSAVDFSETTGDPAKFPARGEDGLSENLDPNNPLDDRLAGNPGYGSLPVIISRNPSPVKNTPPDPSSAADTKPQNPNAVNPSTALPAIVPPGSPQPEWYQESASIEQNRIETAPAVLAGEMTPWPRTPLTPPGTSGKLIGTETFFSDHIPGYRQPPSF